MNESYFDVIQHGPIILPIDRIKLYSSDEWEKFIEEWVDCIKETEGYINVERLGGSGDMGRDVIATVDENGLWDNYQCKHYSTPLKPSEVWQEFAKMVYYSFRKEFSYPRKFLFIAPDGVGTKLANLLKDHQKLKTELKSNWHKYCRNCITVEEIPLDGHLLEYFDSLDFSIYNYITPLQIVKQYKKSPYYSMRFGGGLPERPSIPSPPTDYQANESDYLKKLFHAYSDHLKREVYALKDLEDERQLNQHLINSRKDFFSAEALRLFSRDSLSPGEYERLQEEFLDGIRDELEEQHSDGFRKVLKVVKTARSLQVTDHVLVNRMTIKDKGGICHQLANENKNIQWVDNE